MFPALLLPVATYTLLAAVGVPMSTPILSAVTVDDALVLVGLILMAADLWRSATPTPATARRIILNLLLLMACILELATIRSCETPAFVIMTAEVAITTVLGGFLAMQLKGGNVWFSNK
jgi:hypothetical protein